MEVLKTQEEIRKQVKKIEGEKRKRIDEVKENQEQIKRRMNEMEGRPNH